MPDSNEIQVPPLSVREKWLLATSIFVVVLLIAACFEHSRDWNTTTRFLLTHALVDHGTVEISTFVAKDGELLEHPPTRDLARSTDGRFFCDKAPGLSFLGAIPYSIYRLVTQHAPAVNATGPNEPSDYWVTLGTVGFAAALSAASLFLLALQWGVRPLAATIIAVASIAATYQLIYATLYYGHLLAGCLVLLSFAIFVRPGNSIVAMFLAGTLAGLAITVEYTAVIFSAVAMVIGTLSQLGFRKRRSILPLFAFGAGHIVPLMMLGYYHSLVTGSPFRVPYTLEADELFAYHREGMGVPIHLPTLEAVQGLIIGPTTGLLWYAAIVLGSLPGLFMLARRSRVSAAFLASLTFGALFVVIAGFPNWHGGLSTGPRLLLPALPLVIAPVVVWFGYSPNQKTGWWIQRVLQVSMFVIMMVSLPALVAFNTAGGRMPSMITDPWQQYLKPALDENRLEGHVGKWMNLGLDATLSLGLTVIIVSLLAITPILLAWRWDAGARRST